MSNAQQALVDGLTPFLGERGFKWNKGREGFFRKEPFGFLDLSWSTHVTGQNGGEFVLTPLLAVRHNEVDNIVNELGLIHGDSNRRYTTTVTRSLGFFPFVDGRDETQRIRIGNIESDAKSAASEVRSMFVQYGAAFFDKYSSLAACSEGLNDVIETKSHPLLNNFPMRAYYGLAAAALCEPDRVETLFTSYCQFSLREFPDQYQQISGRLTKVRAMAGAALAIRARSF